AHRATTGPDRPVVGRIEIPQRSSLLPCPGVLFFGRKHGRHWAVKRREFITLLGGATVAWPLAARAQQMRSPYRIGFLGLLPGENTSAFMKSFLERLNELGYREGYNMIFDYRSAEGVPERLPQLAADAVRASPDVLVTGMGTLAAKAAKA